MNEHKANEIYTTIKSQLVKCNNTFVTLDDFYSVINDGNFETYTPDGYKAFAKAVTRLHEEGFIRPTNNSQSNLQVPPLYQKYRVILSLPDYNAVKMEICNLCMPIVLDYYLMHPEEYLKDREYILIINDFLMHNSKPLVSLNERSYELFQDEKFLKNPDKDRVRGRGEAILKNLGLTCNDLNCYQAYEPFFYSLHDSNSGSDTVVIIENKDTFWSFHKLSFNYRSRFTADMLIYGRGNTIINSFQYIETFRMSEKKRYLYFGDIDAEGINICMSLINSYPAFDIVPFTMCYQFLLNNAEASALHKSQRINEENLERFASFFEKKDADIIKHIVRNKLYIPQEALSLASLIDMFGGIPCLTAKKS